MNIVKLNQNNLEQDKISQTIKILQKGGIIIYPTDTIYGIGCDIFNKQAIEKIYQIKKREKRKPMSIICSDLNQVSEYAVFSNTAYRLMKKILPGAYTFILKASPNTPKSFISKNKTVGVRIPDNQICLELVKQLGNPIITTSVNISTQEPYTDPEDIIKNADPRIDLFIDSGILDNEPSSVIDLSNEGSPKIIREGKGDLSMFV